MHLALIHDWLNQIGGAEDVLETLAEMFPSAPVYTSMYWPEKMNPAYQSEVCDPLLDRRSQLTIAHQHKVRVRHALDHTLSRLDKQSRVLDASQAPHKAHQRHVAREPQFASQAPSPRPPGVGIGLQIETERDHDYLAWGRYTLHLHDVPLL